MINKLKIPQHPKSYSTRWKKSCYVHVTLKKIMLINVAKKDYQEFLKWKYSLKYVSITSLLTIIYSIFPIKIHNSTLHYELKLKCEKWYSD